MPPLLKVESWPFRKASSAFMMSSVHKLWLQRFFLSWGIHSIQRVPNHLNMVDAHPSGIHIHRWQSWQQLDC